MERGREFLVPGNDQAESLISRRFGVDMKHRWAALPMACSRRIWTESVVASVSREASFRHPLSIRLQGEDGDLSFDGLDNS